MTVPIYTAIAISVLRGGIAGNRVAVNHPAAEGEPAAIKRLVVLDNIALDPRLFKSSTFIRQNYTFKHLRSVSPRPLFLIKGI